MDIESLKKFCWKDGFNPHGLEKPFNQGGRTWATDGKAIIGVQAIAGFENSKEKPDIAYILSVTPPPDGEWFSLPEIDKSKKCPEYDDEEEHCYCPECKGNGVVSFSNDWSSYTFSCETCEGSCSLNYCPICEGTGIDLNYVVEIDGVRFFAGAIMRLSALPGVKICPTTKHAAAHIRFDGDGVGLIMPSLEHS